MKVLLISYFIAPLSKIGSIRWTKISKYLKRKYDVKIDVLTMKKDFDINPKLYTIEKKDILLERDLAYFNKYIALDYGLMASIYRYFFYQFREIAKKRKSHDHVTKEIIAENKGRGIKLDRGLEPVYEKKQNRSLRNKLIEIKERVETKDSKTQCLRYLKKNGMDKYDVVISTYSPIWTHFVAKKIKSFKRDIYWIADFRDQYAFDLLEQKEFERRKEFACRHLGNADAIFKVADDINLFLPKNFSDHFIPNGYDPEEAVKSVEPRKFNFLFTGSLYEGKRDFSPLFQAIKELEREKRVLIDDISVDYAGADGAEIVKMASKWNLSSIVIDYGGLSRKDTLKLQGSCAILLLADWNTKYNKPFWSGKAYEYMMAKKPIVFIMSGDVPYSRPYKEIHLLGGVCYEEARPEKTMEEVKDFIEMQ